MTKITELDAATTPLVSTDLVEVVQDVGGTPTNKKVAVSELGGGGGGGGGGAAGVAARVATQQGTSSITFTDLATVGPSVTFDVPASGKVLVSVSAQMVNFVGGNAAIVGVALSGANTLAASDDNAILVSATALMMSGQVPLTGLTPGSTTFTVKYRVTANSVSFLRRTIAVQPLA
jgi:hypothetical protein